MTLDLFNQFMAPKFLGISLLLISMVMVPLTGVQHNRLTQNRLTVLQMQLFQHLTKHLMMPLTSRGHKWAAPLLTVLWLLLTLNMLGLMPYTFTPTTHLSLNMALAAPLWICTVLLGLRNQPTTSIAHMLPTGTPLPLTPALVLIETVSNFIRPIALGVRLTANLTAGHLLMTLVAFTTLKLLSLTTTMTTLVYTLLCLLTLLEVAVAMIQAYVFVLLLSLYLQENT
uniref:ATP synthase subunit a n=1 Tax=Paroedura picta TaxID=143630 RepID=A0A0U2KZX1_9SAUR|nr:ATP synthase F0 subunit 6 [Paroedura picta]ALF04034.1 ATP synthase F0 subunit 6 [Paroedura picta]